MERTAVAFKLAVTSTAVALVLTGCFQSNEPPAVNPLPPVTVEPTIPPVTQSPAPSPTDEGHATVVKIDCNKVVDPQTMYDFNPNFGLLSSFTPDAGSLAAQAVANKGVACRWLNQTSGATLDVSIANPSPKDLEALKALAKSGTPVSGLGDSAYFSQSGNTGVLQAFIGPYWLTTASEFFSAVSDAAPIMDAAINAVNQ